MTPKRFLSLSLAPLLAVAALTFSVMTVVNVQPKPVAADVTLSGTAGTTATTPTAVTLFEEFYSGEVLATTLLDATTVPQAYPGSTGVGWTLQQGILKGAATAQARNGAMSLTGDGVALPALLTLGTGRIGSVPGGFASLQFNTGQRLMLEMRVAQSTAAAGFRRCGWSNTALTGIPTNGVWLEWNVNAEMQFACRNAGVYCAGSLIPVGNGVTMANNVFHKARMQVSGGSTGYQVWFDDVLRYDSGTFPGQPATDLNFNCAGSGTGTDLIFDYLLLNWQRAQSA